MTKLQSNQLTSILRISKGQSLIKFCYFTLILSLLACGENKKQESTAEKESEEKPEQGPTEVPDDKKTILCFGDSITAGYGLEDTDEAYPNLLQKKIDSLELDYTVINSGLSGETTAGGKSRISWVLNQKIDIFLLELGANDGLRGVQLSETESNLQSIIDVVEQKSPDTKIILAGMQLPPNMGQEYTAKFQQLFADLAERNNLAFIPFILEGVGGIEALNQKDGIHPTAEGHQIVAENVWKVLSPMLVNEKS